MVDAAEMAPGKFPNERHTPLDQEIPRKQQYTQGTTAYASTIQTHKTYFIFLVNDLRTRAFKMIIFND